MSGMHCILDYRDLNRFMMLDKYPCDVGSIDKKFRRGESEADLRI